MRRASSRVSQFDFFGHGKAAGACSGSGKQPRNVAVQGDPKGYFIAIAKSSSPVTPGGFGTQCCLRPSVAGSALGSTHFRGHLRVHFHYGPVTRDLPEGDLVDGLQSFLPINRHRTALESAAVCVASKAPARGGSSLFGDLAHRKR
jgi:hypothetical protein